MPDFKKHIKLRSAERPTDPVELYARLDRLSDTGPLRPAQEYVLADWHANRRPERDLIVKLHTGQGKTVVGLLMLQSLLNEGIGSALYLCPNKHLADQTCQQAQRFGIPVLNGNKEEELPTGFLNGLQIYVCTVQKLFNGLTKFGLKAASTQVGVVLMDDCHACIDSIKQSCSITLKSDTTAYAALLQLFDSDLQDQGAGTFADIKAKKYDALLPVPYWAWIDRKIEVTGIVGKHSVSGEVKKEDTIRFTWPVLKDMLDKCCCVVSGSEIEITPHIPPLNQFGSFHGAKKRIFMSATVTDDSFLVKGLRLSAATITKPLTYPKESWFGEKMILIPPLIDPETGREQVVKRFASPQEKRRFGTVGLCPSAKKADLWREAGADVAEAGTVSVHVQRLQAGEFDNKAVCIVNRYDGIDLPDKACRILVLDSKPFSGGLTERYIESCRPGSEVTAQRIARMIEQGIGRGVRGEKDYCAVVFVGGDLVRAVQRADVRKFYSSQTRRQIEIGIEIAGLSEYEVQHGAAGIDVVADCVDKLLKRDSGWKDFYADRMADVTLDKPNEVMLKVYTAELDAESKAEEGRYLEAQDSIQAMMDKTSMSQDDRGWYTQEMARLLYRHSKVESAKLQASAHKRNGYLLKPKEGMVFRKLQPLNQKRVGTIIEWASQSQDHQDLMVRVQAILDDLRFGVDSDAFEESFNELGQSLGYATERPDKVWGEGPDNLWCLSAGHYLLVECKNEVRVGRDEIYKGETGQMNNAFAWFSKNYLGAKATCVMIVPAKKTGPGANFNMPVTVMRQNKLKRLAKSVTGFFMEFTAADLNDIEPSAVQKWLSQHSLETGTFVDVFTEPLDI